MRPGRGNYWRILICPQLRWIKVPVSPNHLHLDARPGHRICWYIIPYFETSLTRVPNLASGLVEADRQRGLLPNHQSLCEVQVCPLWASLLVYLSGATDPRVRGRMAEHFRRASSTLRDFGSPLLLSRLLSAYLHARR